MSHIVPIPPPRPSSTRARKDMPEPAFPGLPPQARLDEPLSHSADSTELGLVPSQFMEIEDFVENGFSLSPPPIPPGASSTPGDVVSAPGCQSMEHLSESELLEKLGEANTERIDLRGRNHGDFSSRASSKKPASVLQVALRSRVMAHEAQHPNRGVGIVAAQVGQLGSELIYGELGGQLRAPAANDVACSNYVCGPEFTPGTLGRAGATGGVRSSRCLRVALGLFALQIAMIAGLQAFSAFGVQEAVLSRLAGSSLWKTTTFTQAARTAAAGSFRDQHTLSKPLQGIGEAPQAELEVRNDRGSASPKGRVAPVRASWPVVNRERRVSAN